MRSRLFTVTVMPARIKYKNATENAVIEKSPGARRA